MRSATVFQPPARASLARDGLFAQYMYFKSTRQVQYCTVWGRVGRVLQRGSTRVQMQTTVRAPNDGAPCMHPPRLALSLGPTFTLEKCMLNAEQNAA